MRTSLRVFCICLLALAGASAQPGGLPWRQPTCGLDFDRIPGGLTAPKAVALLRSGSLALPGVVKLVEEYELAEAYPILAGWLERADSESTRLQLFRALAVAGGGKLEARELGGLRATLARIGEDHEWRLALEVLGRLGDASLEEEMAGRIPEDLQNNELPRLRAARTRIEKMMQLPKAERLRAQARLFVGLSDGFEEYLGPWATSRLMRNPSRGEVVDALRKCLLDLPGEGLAADEEPWVRRKILQGVMRFGGKLSAREKALLSTLPD